MSEWLKMNERHYKPIREIYIREKEILLLYDFIDYDVWDKMNRLNRYCMVEQLVAEWYIGGA